MKPLRVPRIPWREIDGQAVIIQPRGGEVHELNAVATFLWMEANGDKTVEEIIESLQSQFNVPEGDCAQKDTEAFFENLSRKGLILWN